MQYIAATFIAGYTKRKWEYSEYWLEKDSSYLKEECILWLGNYLALGGDNLIRTGKHPILAPALLRVAGRVESSLSSWWRAPVAPPLDHGDGCRWVRLGVANVLGAGPMC